MALLPDESHSFRRYCKKGAMKMKVFSILFAMILWIAGCTQVPLINLHASLEKTGIAAPLATASNGIPAIECNPDDSVFKLTYWHSAKIRKPILYYVQCKDHDTIEEIKSKYIWSPQASNKRQLTVTCIDTLATDRYRLKIVSVDDLNAETLIMDQEMHAGSEIDINPQPGKKYYFTLYKIVQGAYRFMKQFTINMPYPKAAAYSGPTIYPVGKNYGKYAFGWGIGLAVTPYATGTYDNYLFSPSVIIFNNVVMVDTNATTAENIFSLENIGIGVSWLYGISGGVIINLHEFKSPQLFFGLNIIEVIGYFL